MPEANDVDGRHDHVRSDGGRRLWANRAVTSTSTSEPPAATPVPVEPDASAGGPPSPSASRASVVVTFEVSGDERFRVELDDAADSGSAPNIPNGRIIRGANTVNTGHDWTLDPADFEWADATTEGCDGRPSDVDHTDTWRVARYCPWTARVVAVDAQP